MSEEPRSDDATAAAEGTSEGTPRRGPASTQGDGFWPGVRTLIGIAVLGPVVAFVVGLFTTFGRDIDPEFYAVVAQVTPVVFLAVLLDTASMLREFRAFAEKHGAIDDPGVRNTLESAQEMPGWVIGTAAVGEGAALYAVASGDSTTFLFLSPTLALAQLLLITFMVHRLVYLLFEA